MVNSLRVSIAGTVEGADGMVNVIDEVQDCAWLIQSAGVTRPHDDEREHVESHVTVLGEIGTSELVSLMMGLLDTVGPERLLKAFGKALSRKGIEVLQP